MSLTDSSEWGETEGAVAVSGDDSTLGWKEASTGRDDRRPGRVLRPPERNRPLGSGGQKVGRLCSERDHVTQGGPHTSGSVQLSGG